MSLCNPMNYTVHGILQARILEWVAMSSSRGIFQPRDQTQISCIAEILYQLSYQGSHVNRKQWLKKKKKTRLSERTLFKYFALGKTLRFL